MATPFSNAATIGAQSVSGMKPNVSKRFSSLGFQEVGDGDDGLRRVGEATALIHRQLAQRAAGEVLAHLALLHQDAFCALDDLAFGKRAARFFKLAAQRFDWDGEGESRRPSGSEDSPTKTSVCAPKPETIWAREGSAA